MSRKFLTEQFQSNSASKWYCAQSVRGGEGPEVFSQYKVGDVICTSV